MSRVMYSKEQQRAIETSGHNILVSASAGSGKTTVLIERILNKLKQGMNIDEMLIVTFTELAASELKQRLRKKLTQELENKSDTHLRMQLTKLPNAEISTFHSFCNRVIKRFFYLIDADALYKISEDVEGYLVAEEVLEAMFTKLYEDNNEDFLHLVARFSSGMNDENLKKLVLDVYNKLRTFPFRKDFIQNTLGNYDFPNLKSWNLYPLFKNNIKSMVSLAETDFIKAKDLAEATGHGYKDQYEDDMKIITSLKQLINERDFDDIYQYLKFLTFNRFNSKGSMDVDETSKLMIKELRDQGKTIISNNLTKKYFAYSLQSQVKFIQENKDLLEKLIDLAEIFEAKFKEAKNDKNIVDFSDLEIMALQILSLNKSQNEATSYYQSQFREILIDEFQDTNSMQETIIRAVSNGNNIFMVGDVKQSIYRFRSAEPEIFQTKYKSYQKPSENGELIVLNDNYRSREEVIDFINYLFVQLMDEAVGEIEYDKAAHLVFGQSNYKKTSLDTNFISLHILEKASINENSDKKYEKAEMEAHYVAQRIRELIDNQAKVCDSKSGLRELTYKDIAILSRTKSDQEVYHDVFKHYDIPFLTTELSGYFDSVEVLTILSVLQIIDNPLQDIPLVATLRSPIFNLNEKELIELKTIGKTNYYFDKINLYLKKGNNVYLIEKLTYFMELLTKWRENVKNEPLSEVIYDLYHNTNYYDFVLGQIGGKQRQANLDLLYERAKQYEHLTSNSLFRFIQLINFIKEKDKDLEQARTVSDYENLVRFITIHKSKGLEFPVVFLTNLSKNYNTQDEKSTLLFDKELGIAFSYLDLTNKVKHNSLYQSIIKDKLRDQMLAEEMRLLYVALTRAKERLYLVGTVDDFPKEAAKLMNNSSHKAVLLPQNERKKTNYLSLFMLSLTRFSKFKEIMNCIENTPFSLTEPDCDIRVVKQLNFKNTLQEKNHNFEDDYKKYKADFDKRLNYQYPHKEKTTHYAKHSIADIKKTQHFSDYNYNKESIPAKTSKFKDITKVNATLRGTTHHIFMQHLNYRESYDLAKLHELKNRLVDQDILTKAQADLLDLLKVQTYLQTNLATSFHEAKNIHQELPFTTLVSSVTLYPEWKEGVDILVQGVIDLFVLNNDEAYLIDFKTDHLNDTLEDIDKLRKRYQIQIDIYKEALQKIYPHKVIKAYLYLFEINHYLEM